MVTSAQGKGAASKRRAGTGRGQDRPSGPIPYNFRRPDKFSKDHIRSIQSIQETFSRFTTNYLANKIRSAVHIELSQQVQATFGEYIDSLPSPTVLFVTELDPLVGNVIMQMDRTLAFMIVDRLLGGSGTAKSDRGSNVTEIEILLLEEIGRGLFNELTSAWEQVAQLSATRCDVILSPGQVQGVLPTEVSLVIRHDIRMFNQRGKISICLPASTLEPLMPRLNARLLFANPRNNAGLDLRDDLASQIENARLDVHVEIGSAHVRVSELTALEVGDIIRLDSGAHDPLLVKIQDRDCFLAQPGQKAGHMAVRIVDYVDQHALTMITGMNIDTEPEEEAAYGQE
jgi:flagellar motor switch protein FliM